MYFIIKLSFLMSYTLFAADLVVIGDDESQALLSGSGQVIHVDEVRLNNMGDINSLLRKNVPGVNLFEEDGQGLFPNISFRGVNSTRSQRVTIMEDGILMAPAPYAAPAAYYSPYVARMSGVEALKGSSQVLYGPATTGGVLNYKSTPLEDRRKIYTKIVHGSFNETQTHSFYADKRGSLSFLIEVASRSTDGFKTIDNSDNVQSTHEDTGHTLVDPSIKLHYQWSDQHQFYVRLGHYKMKANETYLGLTDQDFEKKPYRRYSASRFDRIDTEQDRTLLRHIYSTDDLKINSSLYYNRFYRNWYKLQTINGNTPLGNDDDYFGLIGKDAADLNIRANQRSYESMGIEQSYQLWLDQHELQFGVRLHKDRVKRFQHQDLYKQNADGAIEEIIRGEPGSQADRSERAQALALYLQNNWYVNNQLTIVPGIRFENVNFTYFDQLGDAEEKKGALSFFNPALSARYQLSDQDNIFIGVYKGAALPSPADVVRDKDPLDEEYSYNFEMGYRKNSRVLQWESTLFYTQLRNLLALSSTASGVELSRSIGRANTYGVELKGAFDFGEFFSRRYSQVVYLNGTLSRSLIGGDYQNSSFLTGQKGNRLPYSPDFQMTLGQKLEFEKAGIDFWLTYVGKMYRTGENLIEDKVTGHSILSGSAFYRLSGTSRFIIQGQNLLNRNFMASRSPYGARPGRPLTVLAGLEATF